MTNETPTTEPAAIISGDTVTWKQSLPAYPSSQGWALKYALRSNLGKIDITSSASGDDHLINVTAAVSGAWPPGTYPYQKYVEKGEGVTLERVTLGMGSLIVSPNFAAMTTATETRTWARRCLDKIEAVIEGRCSRSDLEYELSLPDGSRQKLGSMTNADLLKTRDDFASRVWQEEQPDVFIIPVHTVFSR